MVGQILVKRLVKEFQRGGKKSIALALLLGVGLCIWGPMLWRKVFPKMPATTAATASNTSSTENSTRQPTSVIAPIEWKSLYRRLEESSLVHPVALDNLVRDPFDRGWIGEKTTPVVIKPESESAPPSDPLRSLVLSAVLTGAEGGAAVINDVVYRIGQEVPEKGSIRYVLKGIRQDRVFLERAGKLEELSLKESDVATHEDQ